MSEPATKKLKPVNPNDQDEGPQVPPGRPPFFPGRQKIQGDPGSQIPINILRKIYSNMTDARDVGRFCTASKNINEEWCHSVQLWKDLFKNAWKIDFEVPEKELKNFAPDKHWLVYRQKYIEFSNKANRYQMYLQDLDSIEPTVLARILNYHNVNAFWETMKLYDKYRDLFTNGVPSVITGDAVRYMLQTNLRKMAPMFVGNDLPELIAESFPPNFSDNKYNYDGSWIKHSKYYKTNEFFLVRSCHFSGGRHPAIVFKSNSSPMYQTVLEYALQYVPKKYGAGSCAYISGNSTGHFNSTIAFKMSEQDWNKFAKRVDVYLQLSEYFTGNEITPKTLKDALEWAHKKDPRTNEPIPIDVEYIKRYIQQTGQGRLHRNNKGRLHWRMRGGTERPERRYPEANTGKDQRLGGYIFKFKDGVTSVLFQRPDGRLELQFETDLYALDRQDGSYILFDQRSRRGAHPGVYLVYPNRDYQVIRVRDQVHWHNTPKGIIISRGDRLYRLSPEDQVTMMEIKTPVQTARQQTAQREHPESFRITDFTSGRSRPWWNRGDRGEAEPEREQIHPDILAEEEEKLFKEVLEEANRDPPAKRESYPGSDNEWMKYNVVEFLKYVPYSFDEAGLIPHQDPRKYENARKLWMRFIDHTLNEESKKRYVIDKLKTLDQKFAQEFWTTNARGLNLNAIESLSQFFKRPEGLDLFDDPNALWRWWQDKNVAYHLQDYNSIVEYLRQLEYIIHEKRDNHSVMNALNKLGFMATFKNLNKKWDEKWTSAMNEIYDKYKY